MTPSQSTCEFDGPKASIQNGRSSLWERYVRRRCHSMTVLIVPNAPTVMARNLTSSPLIGASECDRHLGERRPRRKTLRNREDRYLSRGLTLTTTTRT